MELGADAVLEHCTQLEPKTYGRSFRMAVIAGRSRTVSTAIQHAVASSPLTAFLHQ
jgi:thiazole synthase ThiGH ThiG subunit